MGLSNFLLGWQICERLNIPLLKLAELCHAGKLTAYRFEDRRQVLASSQCNTKFKYLGNTIFTINPSKTTGITAISKKAIENFSVYVYRKRNCSEGQDINRRSENNSKETSIDKILIKKLAQQRLKGIKEMWMKSCGSEYIVYYNDLMNSWARPEVIWLCKNGERFFELKEEEGDIDLEYLELNKYNNCRVLNENHNGGIKKCVTKLCIKKEQDSFGNIKYVLSEYDSDVIQVVYENFFMNRKCKNVSDEDKNDKYVYLYQYATDCFNKEDLSYSKPLTHEIDFFIFDYDEYKKRFHFLEDEAKSRKDFFNYIEKLMFDKNEIRNVFEYEKEEKDISDDPKKYILDRCKKLKEIYKDNEDNLKRVKAYMLVVEGLTRVEIYQKLWGENDDVNYINTFIFRRLKDFEQLAADNGIPFINPVRWKKKSMDKELIVTDMLKQLKLSSPDE